jgi:hypothetical protein
MNRLVTTLLFIITVLGNTQAQDKYTLTSELYKLKQISTLAQFSSAKSMLVSSYDRNGGNSDGFSGEFSYIRKNADSTLVIFDAKGKGIIDRIWTPTPTTDTLDFYIGDTTKISFSIPFIDLFSGKVYPFVQPLCNNELGGYYAYLPIPYNNGCKIVFRGKTLRFLQIQYRELDKNTEVKNFTLNLNSEEKKTLTEVANIWSGNKSIRMANTKLSKKDISLKPQSEKEIFKLNKGGRILGIEIDNADLFENELNNIDIKVSYDNEKYPAIYTPIADFFGYAFGKIAMQSLVSGTKNNTNYFYLPMPFDEKARISIISRSDKTIEFSTRVYYSNVKRDKLKEGKLYVEWNKLLESVIGEEMVMAKANGRGHYVGTIMQTQTLNPGMTMFFEGDDIAFVDGENTIHGTGSEDYFNGGWYAFLDTWDRAMNLPLHGSTEYSLVYGRTGAYRWHLNDKVSFNKSLDYKMEHGPDGNKEQVTNTTLGFYYCDTPKQHFTKPNDELSVVYKPKIYMLYPQMMNFDFWVDVEMKTKWCIPSGGYIYIFKVQDESKIRVSLDEIPEGKYKVYLDYNKTSNGCEFSVWQRQNQLTDFFESWAEKESRMGKKYLCDYEVNKVTNTLTFRFKTEEEKNKFSLNRLIFEKID